MPAPYKGGCQCGAVRYELSEEPLGLIACHCTECQRQSGSAFGMSMHIRLAAFKLTGPTRTFTRKADSGHDNIGTFCPDCGNRIFNATSRTPGVASLKPGTLDDTSWLKPTAYIWHKSAQGWVPQPEGIAVHEGQMPPRT